MNWLLWIDCIGGLIVGGLVLLLRQFLCHIEGLPLSIIVFMGIANLVYGSYSLFVTTRNPRPTGLVRMLALANMAWLIVCIGIVFTWFDEISVIGTALVIGEGIYVAALGFTEWKLRFALACSQSEFAG